MRNEQRDARTNARIKRNAMIEATQKTNERQKTKFATQILEEEM